MAGDQARVRDFARRYADAWGSHDPAAVASYYAPAGTIAINGGPRMPIVAAANGFSSRTRRWSSTGRSPAPTPGPAVAESRSGSPDSKSGRSARTASSALQTGTTTRPSTTANWSREPPRSCGVGGVEIGSRSLRNENGTGPRVTARAASGAPNSLRIRGVDGRVDRESETPQEGGSPRTSPHRGAWARG